MTADGDYKVEQEYISSGMTACGTRLGPIKLTHIPTGLQAVCGKERSQHKNIIIARAMIEWGLIELGYKAE